MSSISAGEIVLPIKQLATEEQMLKAMGISLRHLRNLRARRLVPYIKLGRAIRFDPAAVNDALTRLTIGPKS